MSDFPDGIYTVQNKTVYCHACNKEVPCEKSFQLKQHNETGKHRANFERFKGEKKKQSFLRATATNNNREEFSQDLCNALIGANIPINKINYPAFKNFLTKYCKRTIPSDQTLRNCVEVAYLETMSRIKQTIGDSYIWASVDETTDIKGRYVANLIVGKLDSEGFHRPNLISVRMLEQTNHSTIARFVVDGLRDILSSGAMENRLLLLVTDAARYMVKAAREVLSALYSNMIHQTCLCHALHRVAEQIRFLFPDVDNLTSNVKKVFTKAPTRISLFRELCSNLPLPPAPILTRWGTWIEAAVYYSKNFDQIKAMINKLDEEDAISIKLSQQAFASLETSQMLAYIHSYFAVIPSAIGNLESEGMELTASLRIFLEVKSAVKKAPGEIGRKVEKKFEYVMRNNPGLERLLAASKVLSGDFDETNTPSPNVIAAYKYAPVVSCDVERSFSIYKNILAENRTNFTPKKLEMYIVCNCEANC